MPPRRSLVVALPAAAAVGVFGVSYGVLAVAAGVPGWLAVAMSAVVFAGSAQFAFVAAFAGPAAGASAAASAVVSGALLNTRYLAVGGAVAHVLPGSRWRRLLLGQLVIDESYALAVGAGSRTRPDTGVLLWSGAVIWLFWVVGSAVGVALGPVLGDPRDLGLDAAFPALFVALLWPMLDRPGLRAAAAGAGAALLLAPFTPAGVPLAGAAVAGLLVARP